MTKSYANLEFEMLKLPIYKNPTEKKANMWWFPEIGIPPKSSISRWDGPWNKPPSYWGTPMAMEIPTSDGPARALAETFQLLEEAEDAPAPARLKVGKRGWDLLFCLLIPQSLFPIHQSA